MTPDERRELILRYATGPARLRAAYEATPEAARKWRPEPGEFSVHEVVCHCADSETNAAGRIRYVVASPDPLVLGYDPSAWAATLDYHAHPAEAALAAVDAVRTNTVPVLERLPEEAWTRSGTHTESGAYSAEDWLRTYSEHVEEHVEQIERAVAAWRRAHGESEGG